MIERLSWGQAHPPASYHTSPLAQGFHLSVSASARHPGLNVELAIGRKAQFLGGHVQHPEAKVENRVKVKRMVSGRGGHGGGQKEGKKG